MREALAFYEDSYRRELETRVHAVERGAVILDRTIFFPTTADIQGDTGSISIDGRSYPVKMAIWADSDRRQVAHVLDEPTSQIPIGAPATSMIDWGRRYLRMRAHTALHMVACVLPFPIVDGALFDGYGYKDFAVSRSGVRAADIERLVAYFLDQGLAVQERWIERQHIQGHHHLRLVPNDGGRDFRTIQIGELPPELCDGLHVHVTTEVCGFAICKVETIDPGRWRVWLDVRTEADCKMKACA